MEKLTEAQLNKINKHLSEMNESQQDTYIQKLEEAGLLKKILASFGSPKTNIAKLVKQRDASVKQLNAMKSVITSSKSQNATQEAKNADIAAIDAIIQKLNAINLNITIDETPAQNVDGEGADKGQAEGNQ